MEKGINLYKRMLEETGDITIKYSPIVSLRLKTT